MVGYHRTTRAAYLNAEGQAPRLELHELLEQPMSIGDFPGYRYITLPKSTLDVIVSESVESWRAALSAVAGVYLITDTRTGKLYVGSATGEGGIWARWC